METFPYGSIFFSVMIDIYLLQKNLREWMKRPLKKGSGYMVPKHVAFAPASQKQHGTEKKMLTSLILILTIDQKSLRLKEEKVD